MKVVITVVFMNIKSIIKEWYEQLKKKDSEIWDRDGDGICERVNLPEASVGVFLRGRNGSHAVDPRYQTRSSCSVKSLVDDWEESMGLNL